MGGIGYTSYGGRLSAGARPEVVASEERIVIPAARLAAGSASLRWDAADGEFFSHLVIVDAAGTRDSYAADSTSIISAHIDGLHLGLRDAQSDGVLPVYRSMSWARPFRSLVIRPQTTGTPASGVTFKLYKNVPLDGGSIFASMMEAWLQDQRAQSVASAVNTGAVAMTGATEVLVLAANAGRRAFRLSIQSPTRDVFWGDATVTNESVLATCGGLLAQTGQGPADSGWIEYTGEVYVVASGATTQNVYFEEL